MYGLGMWRPKHGTPKKEPPPGKQMSGYLWGLGNPVDIVGNVRGWHFRASAGLAIADWELYFGNRQIGLSVYPTNETKDWPDLLAQMIRGLSGIEDNPLSDEEVDAIHQAGIEAAQNTRGFPGTKEFANPRCPHPAGSREASIWEEAFRNEYAKKNGSDFLSRGRRGPWWAR